jgi:hypothetical protein
MFDAHLPRAFVLAAIALLLAGCRTATGAGPEPAEESKPSHSPTPSQAGLIALPAQDQVVFTIENPEAFSGLEGEPRPDWTGWGAQAFAIGPDGNFWIADTAVHPQRVLHFDPAGQPLAAPSLDGQADSIYDILATDHQLWILDLAIDSVRLLKLPVDGGPATVYELPPALLEHEGLPVQNGITTLWLGDDSELITSGVQGLHLMNDSNGRLVAEPLDQLLLGGHSFAFRPDPVNHRLRLALEGTPIPIDPPLLMDAPGLIDSHPSAGFALSLYRETPVECDTYCAQVERLVGYYSPEGNLLGMARQRPSAVWTEFGHDLALGPDGHVYQLVSNPDHSVEVVRLGFTPELPPERAWSPTPAPTPLTQMLPPDQPLSQDDLPEAAGRAALLTFFSSLYLGDYEAAASLYGGDFNELDGYDPREAEEDLAVYWDHTCDQHLCLPVAEITASTIVSEDELLLEAVFMWDDGRRLEIGACCGGNPAEFPPVWRFRYPVMLVQGQWKVMRGPLFIP